MEKDNIGTPLDSANSMSYADSSHANPSFEKPGSDPFLNRPRQPNNGYYPPQGPPPGFVPPYAPAFPYWGQPPMAPARGMGIFGRFLLSIFLFGVSCLFLLFVLLVMLAGFTALFAKMGETETSLIEKTIVGSATSGGKIAIIPIEGIIRGEEEGFVRRAIRQAQSDGRVDAIVLRVNTPGGTMSGSDYYHYLLKELKKEKDIPIIISMGAMAASGGYYVSMVGDKIFAEPSTMTGSIGVVIPLYDAADLCKKIGFSSNAITSGPMKGMGDFSKPMKDDERVIWQHLVDNSYDRFLEVIREGRPAFAPASQSTSEEVKPDDAKKREAELRKIADGRIYTAQDALELGLVDEIGFLDKAVLCAIERAGLDQNNVHVVRYRSLGGFSAIFSEAQEQMRGNNVSQILSKTLLPEIYYLCPGTFPIGDEKR